MTKKFCTKCGKPFDAVGREVICPSCKAAAAEEARHAAVMRAKQASWRGESVPVRISGRASTIIRKYGAEKSLPFAAALDALLQASDYFKQSGKAWNDITPYKSRRLKKSTTEQDVPQDVPQDVQEVKAAKVNKTVKTSKAAGKAASKASASKK